MHDRANYYRRFEVLLKRLLICFLYLATIMQTMVYTFEAFDSQLMVNIINKGFYLTFDVIIFAWNASLLIISFPIAFYLIKNYHHFEYM
jgi:hypothetical protein